MKKWIALLLALVSLCLGACGQRAEKDASLSVVIEEGEGFTVENNAQRVQPGEDAVFLLHLDRGISILSANYRGELEITEKDGVTELRLKDLRCPTRVRLQTASKKGQIRYEANGGAAADGSTSLVKNHSLTVHPRANTAIGTDLFSRDLSSSLPSASSAP